MDGEPPAPCASCRYRFIQPRFGEAKGATARIGPRGAPPNRYYLCEAGLVAWATGLVHRPCAGQST